VEEVPQPRVPLVLVPGRPTKSRIEDHSVCHWPFRSRGRAQGSPHRSRSELDREHSRLGHPTISLDHCFRGSAGDDEMALGIPFLVPMPRRTCMRLLAPRKVASLGLLNTCIV
jgi:hypothetical protein